MNRLAITMVVLAFALGAASQAQTPAQKPTTVPAQDQTFAREAAEGGLAEVELGKLATENAGSADVKQFGQRMITDHSKANDELKAIAQKLSITLPTAVAPKHKALRDKLAKLKGSAFDTEYMREMVKDHEQDVAKFQKEARGGLNTELKAFASKTVPILEEHLSLAKDINAKVGGSKPPKK